MVVAATVDHGLRPESADEARFVAALCRERRIPHEILSCTLEAGNLQDRARSARYSALDSWAKRRGLAAIVTAHHADDQAETVLMRLNRGSGLVGLAGIRACTTVPESDTILLRPLLSWRRSELGQLVEAAEIDPVRDPSNEDERFERVRIRKLLRDADWIDPSSLARSAAHLAEAEAALSDLVVGEWTAQVRRDARSIRYQPVAPGLVRKMVVQLIVAEFSGRADLSQIAQLVDRLDAGKGGNLAGVMARSRQGEWSFEAEPPRRVSGSQPNSL